MNMKLNIDNYYELLALHRSMMAVKFDPNSCLAEAQGSPFTGSLAFKIFDLLLNHFKEQGNTKEIDAWLSWQMADKTNSETKLLLDHIKKAEWWNEASSENKEKFIIDFMAPLKLNPRLQDEIIKSS